MYAAITNYYENKKASLKPTRSDYKIYIEAYFKSWKLFKHGGFRGIKFDGDAKDYQKYHDLLVKSLSDKNLPRDIKHTIETILELTDSRMMPFNPENEQIV